MRLLPIKDEPGYFVGDDGSVWSSKTKSRTPRFDGPLRRMKCYGHTAGYLVVNLSRGRGKTRPRFVHRLVLEAFIGPCPAGMETRHLNGDRKDNRLHNLAWGTNAENHADKDRHGTMPRGATHWRAKRQPA